jgi:S-adenosyl-L-methionine hydrolase (adenosine-forming)
LPVITLLTDFGTADGYVAQMKGVLVTGAPGAELVDLSHEIPPQDVELARLAVARYWRWFPPGTVHLVVVDPEVGGARAAMAVASDGRYLVGPDNGVLSPALLVPGARAVALATPAGASPTFHGRDVFAPAAAALARGIALEALGAPFAEPRIRRTPEPIREPDGGLRGEVIALDRFGNAVTNLVGVRGGIVSAGARRIPVRLTYVEVPVGELLALVGSSGLLEIAQRNGSAAALGVKRGTVVRWHPDG